MDPPSRARPPATTSVAFENVARVSEIPVGRGLCVRIRGIEVGLFRVGEEVYAMENRCPHAGDPLSEGLLEGPVVFCRAHGWKFDVRTGFRPHTARIFLCRATGGVLRPSAETPRVRWFPIRQIPDTLFPWYRAPLEDALADLPEPVERHEHQGPITVWAGMKIDFRMRVSDDRAGSSGRGSP